MSTTMIAAPKLHVDDLLTLIDLTQDEIVDIIKTAIELKKLHKAGQHLDVLKGKTMGMIFEKSSTRTRVSFEAGMTQLGGHSIFLSSKDTQLGRGEPISDTAQVLSEYIDIIMIRTFEHERVVELAKHATIPVINALTDDYHPCQALADLMTIYEIKGSLKGQKLVYVGDGNNVAHSLMIGSAKVGVDCIVACPDAYQPKAEVVEIAKKFAEETGATIEVVNDPIEAVKGADFIYTDVWTSMGFEDEAAERIQTLQPYQVNAKLMQYAKDDYSFMHCLPAHRGEEVTADIIDGPHSVVVQEAGNRLHVQKALILGLLNK
ncbi:ornithine carbamoyltransferase [Schinkia azotoformans]|uniref:Ornithine carbamoyltransferase n=1 Tax=Schinkia azotoformans LMG 9581 TaxID=1131731 RepID=K6BWQ0_SCHAZ|nr:ornithine carbamoyltransferase [Schinkia azotoformans]EKN63370.1 ornithine carbamoyltransferase [Schinkia azotoformans LMG 9581]MEC1638669.1 ornithine carbamoyltransferase [Schinkia azotoformans]MEC1719272.1 ornithine carbamoyltransferase [Schinkia azotoformans]MEC1946634.1 ornithine carbamoyltransferase [Schinkia azotoformans]MED4353341.1 ornithine carbamoyltransferase [Schinkia azotoformans]